MRRWCSVCAVLLFCLVLLPSGCTEERSPVQPQSSALSTLHAEAEVAAAQVVNGFDWIDESSPDEASGPATLNADWPDVVEDLQREVISGDVVHYSATVRTGPGVYDRIGIHRVVRERAPNRPIKSKQALFLLHGDLKNFEGMWLPGQFSPHLPDDFGLAAFLAQHDVDVWGIDQAWNLIPAWETDFSYMQDWGIQREASHLDLGVAVARVARRMTGNGYKPILLLGYSSGAATGYALINQETQLPPGRRQVNGFIAADMGVASDDPVWMEVFAAMAAATEELYDSGQYQDALIFRTVAILARDAPDDPSPFYPGFTNLETVLFFGGGAFLAPALTHYLAPIMEDGFPVGFQFVSLDQWIDFLENTAAYQPLLFQLQWLWALAGYEVPFDDYLSEVTIPVFDIGGAGGFAPYTAHTVELLGSRDITQLHVSVNPPGGQAVDYGHIDIFTAWNAPDLVWRPILDWVTAHSGAGHRGGGQRE